MIHEYTCRLGLAHTGKAHRQARATRFQAPARHGRACFLHQSVRSLAVASLS